MRHFSFLMVLVSVTALSACSSMKKLNPFGGNDEVVKPATKEELANALSDEELFNEGMAKLQDGFYSTAIEKFQEIERLYPFSKFAIEAQANVARAYYKDEEYDSALATIDRFIRTNPGNKAIEDMYYLRALCYYEQIADIERDQQVTEKALDALNDVMERFPDSDYARNAELKKDLVIDHLAGKEMEVGRYYEGQKKYIAAVNRFNVVANKYQNTGHVEEALYRLTETYLLMGLPEEAKKNAAVLGHNYPASKWYQYAYDITEKGADAPRAAEDEGMLHKLFTKERRQENLVESGDRESSGWWDSVKEAF